MIGTLILALAMTTGMELTKTSRDVKQDRGEWIITYKLKVPVDGEFFLHRSRVNVRLSGQASNSAVPYDGIGRPFSFSASDADRQPGNFGRHLIHNPSDENNACKMRVSVELGGGEMAVVGRDGEFDFRLKLGHDHAAYGVWEPLLGDWNLDVDVDGFRFRDVLPLTSATRALPDLTIKLLDEWLDDRYYVSPPNSLYLDSREPCDAYRQIKSLPVRPGTKLRFSFRYLIANGTEGEPTITLGQAIDSDSLYKRLFDHDVRITLLKSGEWREHSTIIKVSDQASSLDIYMRIRNSEVGEMWVDDIRLEEVGFSPKRNP